jgi:ubiquinone/menaquinone biosynthesis C-methylase UbiE
MKRKVSGDRFKRAQVYQRRYWDERWKDNQERQQQAKEIWNRYINILKAQADLKPSDKILDIGCGPCGMINFITVGERYGLDPLMDYYLSNFDMPPEVKWIKGLGEALPFADKQFKIVIATDTLDHTENPGKVLKEIKRVLKDGGFAFLTLNTYSQTTNLIKNIHRGLGIESPAELSSFSFKQVRRLLESFGFRIVNSWHDILDLEVTTAASGNKAGSFKNNFRKACKIRQQDGLKEALKFTLAFLTGGRSYQGDSVFIATKP